MGNRYILVVRCKKCGFIDNDVWYAPTCAVMTWCCPKCSHITDLEEYSGIDAESCANTDAGVKSVRRLKEKIKGDKK